MSRTVFNVTEGPLLKKIILYTIPIILTSLLQLFFNAADLMVVGSKNEIFVGAVGSTSSLIHLIINLFIGLGGGISVVTAHSLGAKDHKATQKTVHTAIPLAVAGGTILTFIGFFGADLFLSLMGTPDDVIEYSVLYMKIYFIGMIPNLLYNFGAAILRAAGDTKGPLYFLIISGIINVLLNLLFVYAFDMTVDGVALATIISQAISAVLVLYSLSRRQDACRFSIRDICFDPTAFKEIVKIGVPAGIQSSLYSVANVIIQSSINSFGTVALSGLSAAANLEGFAYVCINAFYHTALNFTGQNYGANKLERIGKVYGQCAACTFVVGVAISIIFALLGPFMLSLYSVKDPSAVSYGYLRLLCITIPYFLCGVLDVTTGVMRGVGSSFVPMLISVIGICVTRLVWVFLVFELLFPFPERTPTAAFVLFLSYPVSWALTLIAEFTAYRIVIKKKKAVLAQ